MPPSVWLTPPAVEIVRKPADQVGFAVHPRRSVVERCLKAADFAARALERRCIAWHVSYQNPRRHRPWTYSKPGSSWTAGSGPLPSHRSPIHRFRYRGAVWQSGSRASSKAPGTSPCRICARSHRQRDDLGYYGMLLPTGKSCEDSWVIARRWCRLPGGCASWSPCARAFPSRMAALHGAGVVAATRANNPNRPSLRHGLRWRDAPVAYGPHKTLYNRFVRWSRSRVFNRIARPGVDRRLWLRHRCVSRSAVGKRHHAMHSASKEPQGKALLRGGSPSPAHRIETRSAGTGIGAGSRHDTTAAPTPSSPPSPQPSPSGSANKS